MNMLRLGISIFSILIALVSIPLTIYTNILNSSTSLGINVNKFININDITKQFTMAGRNKLWINVEYGDIDIHYSDHIVSCTENSSIVIPTDIIGISSNNTAIISVIPSLFGMSAEKSSETIATINSTIGTILGLIMAIIGNIENIDSIRKLFKNRQIIKGNGNIVNGQNGDNNINGNGNTTIIKIDESESDDEKENNNTGDNEEMKNETENSALNNTNDSKTINEIIDISEHVCKSQDSSSESIITTTHVGDSTIISNNIFDHFNNVPNSHQHKSNIIKMNPIQTQLAKEDSFHPNGSVQTTSKSSHKFSKPIHNDTFTNKQEITGNNNTVTSQNGKLNVHGNDNRTIYVENVNVDQTSGTVQLEQNVKDISKFMLDRNDTNTINIVVQRENEIMENGKTKSVSRFTISCVPHNMDEVKTLKRKQEKKCNKRLNRDVKCTSLYLANKMKEMNSTLKGLKDQIKENEFGLKDHNTHSNCNNESVDSSCKTIIPKNGSYELSEEASIKITTARSKEEIIHAMNQNAKDYVLEVSSHNKSYDESIPSKDALFEMNYIRKHITSPEHIYSRSIFAHNEKSIESLKNKNSTEHIKLSTSKNNEHK